MLFPVSFSKKQFKSLYPHLLFVSCSSIKRTLGARLFRSFGQKIRASAVLMTTPTCVLPWFCLILPENTPKRRKNELSSGRQKFVFNWRRWRDLICIFFPAGKKIAVLPPSRPAASRCPPDICILMGSNPSS